MVPPLWRQVNVLWMPAATFTEFPRHFTDFGKTSTNGLCKVSLP